jgi:hypothetical protein
MIDYAAPTLPTQSVPLVRGGADRVPGDAISLIARDQIVPASSPHLIERKDPWTSN